MGNDVPALTIPVNVSDNLWSGSLSATIHGIIFGTIDEGQFGTVPFKLKGVFPSGETVEFMEIPTQNLIQAIYY